MTSKTNDEILADIAAALPSATTPHDLRTAMEAFSSGRSADIQEFRLGLLTLSALFIAQHADPADREVVERVCAIELVGASAMLSLELNRRLARESSAARFAIVSYDVFETTSQSRDWHAVLGAVFAEIQRLGAAKASAPGGRLPCGEPPGAKEHSP